MRTPGPLRVLIARPDVMVGMSGVERFYHRVVARHPNIHFTVLQRPSERPVPHVADNVETLSYGEDVGPCLTPPNSSWIHEVLHRSARNVAAGVAGRHFDVVDAPADFPFTHLLPSAFAEYRVSCGAVVLGLHGWSSDAVANELGPRRGALVASLAHHERLALEAADIRYAFSPITIADARARSRHPVVALDPSDVSPAMSGVAAAARGGEPVDIVQIGARAGYKGGDLLIKIAAGASRALVRRVVFVGRDDGAGPDQTRAPTEYLRQCAADCGVDIAIVDSPTDAWIEEHVYGQRTIVALCSRPRSETFGFAACEALLRGVPILLSSHAGLADVLRDSWPSLPATMIDPFDIERSRAALSDLAANYDDRRDDLAAALAARPAAAPRMDFLREAYTTAPSFAPEARARAAREYREVIFAKRADETAPRAAPMQSTQPVHVAFVVDEAMVDAVSAAIRTIVRHASTSRDYRVTVLHEGLTPASQAALRSMSRAGATVDLLPSPGAGWPVGPAPQPFPPITFARLLIPEIEGLPRRILYLDADVIALRDVAELYDTDLGPFAIGAVPDELITAYARAGWPPSDDPLCNDRGRYFRRHVEIAEPHLASYFNAGVLLMDCDRLRASQFGGSARAFFERKGRWLKYSDQDILNHVFQGDYLVLEPKWNVFSRYARSVDDDRGAAILHFSGCVRPWVLASGPGAGVFRRAATIGPDSW